MNARWPRLFRSAAIVLCVVLGVSSIPLLLLRQFPEVAKFSYRHGLDLQPFVFRMLPGDQDDDGMPDGMELYWLGLSQMFDRYNGAKIAVLLSVANLRGQNWYAYSGSLIQLSGIVREEAGSWINNTAKHPIPVELNTSIGTLEYVAARLATNAEAIRLRDTSTRPPGYKALTFDFDYFRSWPCVAVPPDYCGDVHISAKVVGHASASASCTANIIGRPGEPVPAISMQQLDEERWDVTWDPSLTQGEEYAIEINFNGWGEWELLGPLQGANGRGISEFRNIRDLHGALNARYRVVPLFR